MCQWLHTRLHRLVGQGHELYKKSRKKSRRNLITYKIILLLLCKIKYLSTVLDHSHILAHRVPVHTRVRHTCAAHVCRTRVPHTCGVNGRWPSVERSANYKLFSRIKNRFLILNNVRFTLQWFLAEKSYDFSAISVSTHPWFFAKESSRNRREITSVN